MSYPSRYGPRRNHAIRASQVRAIDPAGRQLGVLPTSEALKLAQQLGVDLIEIAPNANPPVCRIMDFGKYRYDQSKKETHKKATKLKEVKFRVKIEQNDYMTKLRRAEAFLLASDKVKLTLSFRGRELGHPELGLDVVMRAIEDLKHVATPDAQPRQAGRAINVMLSPLPTSKRQRKYTEADEVASDEPDADDAEE